MRMLLAAPWLGLLAIAIASCGGAKASSSTSSPRSSAAIQGSAAAKASSRTESIAAPRRGDSDGDSPEQSAFDSDDFHSMHFGHAADALDSRAIAAVVKRYYRALASEDSATVCALLLEVVAESLPEDDVGGAGPQPPGRHGSCATAVSGALVESHRALLAESRTLRVVSVRVRRRRASAILRFDERAARHILLYKESGAWKIGTLADEDLG